MLSLSAGSARDFRIARRVCDSCVRRARGGLSAEAGDGGASAARAGSRARTGPVDAPTRGPSAPPRACRTRASNASSFATAPRSTSSRSIGSITWKRRTITLASAPRQAAAERADDGRCGIRDGCAAVRPDSPVAPAERRTPGRVELSPKTAASRSSPTARSSRSVVGLPAAATSAGRNLVKAESEVKSQQKKRGTRASNDSCSQPNFDF